MSESWEARVADVWARSRGDLLTDEQTIAAIAALASERPDDDPAALFERAGSYDSAGRENLAAPLYRRALEGELDDARRIQALIQLGSTLRNLGEIDESITVLQEAVALGTHPVTGDAASVFLAFSLLDAGRAREAALDLIRVIEPTLPRYRRSVDAYARMLEETS